jgi:cytoskeletal protein RodZ
VSLAVLLVLLLPATAALAQISVDPTVTPELNTGGWVRGMAGLLAIIGLIVILLVVVAYVRFAPRFSTDETSFKVVRADRVRPGEELPRRTVDIKEAVPVIVAPPPLPERAGVAASASAPAAAPAPTAAPESGGPAIAAPERAPAPPAQAGPGAEAPSEEAPGGEPASEAQSSVEAPAAAETPAAQAAAPAQAAQPAAPAEHVEVTMDQEVFEQTLQELLAKGTDKRVAEGQAKRAGMIAARKKAAGG